LIKLTHDVHRLYYLLGERTRADHMEMERKVRSAREMKTDAVEDHATLTQHMHDMRAAKEDSERQLHRMKRMLEEAKKDWLRKMKDRKKEVSELKRRQEREELREQKRCVRLAALMHDSTWCNLPRVQPSPSKTFIEITTVDPLQEAKARRRGSQGAAAA
jgi:hypothetical protein